jgi:hypothetical protein
MMKYSLILIFLSAFSVFAMEQTLFLQGTVTEQVTLSEPEFDVDQGNFSLSANSDHPYKVYVTVNGKKQELSPEKIKYRGRGPASASNKTKYSFSKFKGKNRIISIEAI